MYGTRIEQLFTRSPLEFIKQQTRKDIQREIKDDDPLYGVEGGNLRQKLLRKYTLSVAVITNKKSRVTEDRIEYVISFTGGNGGFFHYSPTKKVEADKPKGDAISDTVYLYFENSNDAVLIKEQIKKEDEDFSAWYELVKAEVEEFNKSLPGVIDELIQENKVRIKREKELEEELNS